MGDRHPHLLRTDDSLLVVIDMQEPFLRGVRKQDDLIRNVNLLIESARILGVPVLATVQNREKLGGIVPDVMNKLPPTCSPVDKICFSCAGEDAFSRDIADSGRQQIVICGVETHICVSQTALDLLARGYQVHVAGDSVSSRHKSTHELGLRKMLQAGVILTSAEAAVYEMLYSADAPQFRDILRLIKEAS